MSKIRVYELAKELGLENKIILDMCDSLEIEGKKSHSSTLSDDEADRIRRSILRQAVSEREGLVRSIEKEGSLLTERRVGNVIRRRKKSSEEGDEPAGPQIDLSDVPKSSMELPTLAPDHVSEVNSRAEALARANALFDTKREPEPVEFEAESEPEPVTVVEPTPLAEEPEEVVSEAKDEKPVATFEQFESPLKLEPVGGRQDMRGARVLGKIELPARPQPAPRRTEEKREVKTVVEEKPDASRVGKAVKKKFQVAEEELADYERPSRLKKKKPVVLSKDDLLDYDDENDGWRSRRDKKRKKDKENGDDGKALKKVVKIDSEISVGELAKAMGAKLSEVMSQLMNLGIMATINQLLDYETATVIASEFGVTTTNIGRDDEVYLKEIAATSDESQLMLRPPVVTVMGHVDHGKTSLLDAIRKTSVTAKEAGGITQHIGAYNVTLPTGGSVTFLDTPGHEAFTAMRMRGAKVTDIVVLVVAADDGVMPQTIEALNHARAANVPIIVAVNKIDKESANLERIKNQLSEHQLIPEEWGGDTIFVPVSAHTRQGLDLLLDNLYAQAEILELKSNPNRKAVGTVVESKLDRGRGPVLTVLVQDGTLKKGDPFLCGSVAGRVRALISSDGTLVDEAGPSIPVEVWGANSVPLAGDDFYVLNSEAETREIAEKRERTARLHALGAVAKNKVSGAFTVESFSEFVTAGEMKELPVIVKGDVQGSVEAVSGALEQLSSDSVRARVIHKGAGAITENDIQLAVASRALVIGFNVRADSRASVVAESEGVRIVYSRIIYELVDTVKQYLLGMKEPESRETTLGRVEVRQTFKVPRLGMIAGSYVLDGVVQRGALVRLLRDNRVIYEGKMASLRRFKDDVKEVSAGYECGIGIEGYNDIKDGDIIEVYKIETLQPQGLSMQ